MRSKVGLLVVSLVLISQAQVWAAEVPVAVSPGHSTAVAQVEMRCPTFSWGAVPGATSYELVVYRLDEAGEETGPVLRRRFAGSAYSWTPSLDRCLKRGDRYAWSVRAISRKEASDWSPPSLFEVVSLISETEFLEALATMRRETEERQGLGRVTWPAAPAGVEPLPAARRDKPSGPRAPDSGTSSLVAYGDSCCNGNLPSNYAAELGNNHDLDDPDVLALVVSEKNQPAASVNYIGFFHRKELGGGTELVGEIEGDAAGGLHFTGSAASARISGWERVDSGALTCPIGPLDCLETVTCPGSKNVLGGGFKMTSAPVPFLIVEDHPSSDSAWSVRLIRDDPSAAIAWQVYAICAEVDT